MHCPICRDPLLIHTKPYDGTQRITKACKWCGATVEVTVEVKVAPKRSEEDIKEHKKTGRETYRESGERIKL